MRLRKFKPEDGMVIKDDIMEVAWNGLFTVEKFQSITGPAFTAVHEGKIIACAGVILHGDEGMGWALFAKNMTLSTAFDGAVLVRDTLMKIIRDHRLKTVYASARSDFHKGQRYLHFLGFTKVGPIESNQRDGAGALMYVKEVA